MRSAGGSRASIPDEPLELEEYSHFGMVGRYTAGAMNLPFFPLRTYFETDLPVANPLIRPIDSPYGDETHLRRPAAAARRRDRPRAARRRPAATPRSGGCSGCQKEAAFAADRVIVVVEELVDEAVDPRRPQPDDHPGPHRRRGRRRAVRRASLVRPGRLRPRQPLLPRLGPDHPRRGRRPGLAREWVYDVDDRAEYVEKLGPNGSRRCDRAPRRRPARSTTGSTDDRAGAGRGVHQVRDDDRGGGARAGRASASASSASACPTSRSTSRSGPSRPELELVYEAGVFGARPARLPLSHRRSDDRHRRHGGRQHARAVRLLPAGRPDRRRVPGRRPDRPVRQHQHDRHRRLRRTRRRACPARAARARSPSTPARCS